MDSSCGLSLDAKLLDNSWFTITQPLKNYLKLKKIRF